MKRRYNIDFNYDFASFSVRSTRLPSNRSRRLFERSSESDVSSHLEVRPPSSPWDQIPERSFGLHSVPLTSPRSFSPYPSSSSKPLISRPILTPPNFHSSPSKGPKHQLSRFVQCLSLIADLVAKQGSRTTGYNWTLYDRSNWPLGPTVFMTSWPPFSLWPVDCSQLSHSRKSRSTVINPRTKSTLYRNGAKCFLGKKNSLPFSVFHLNMSLYDNLYLNNCSRYENQIFFAEN